MKKFEWLNIDYVLARVNWHLCNHAYRLIEPDQARGICYEEGKFLLIDLFGEIVLEDVDLAEFAEGFNMFKPKESFEFAEFIAKVCEGLLIRLGNDFESTECEICADLQNSATVRGDALVRGMGCE